MAEEIKLNDQQIARRQKMDSLRTQGIDPFGHAFERTHRSSDVKREFGEKTAEELEALTTEVKVAGRIMSKRRMGKLGFMHLKDRDGLIQVVVNKRIVGDDVYEIFKQSDLGDIVGITGRVIKTQSGELSIEAHTYEHLTKSLRPLPEKFHGLTDKEERYRRRYLDLIMNDESMKVAFMRPQILSAIRTFLGNRDFTEVETPVLTTLLTGASARPFYTHHNALDIDCNLRIAPELYLKECIVAGFDRVYELAKCFRNEGMDTQHLQEFTQVEWYVAYWRYEDNIKFFTNFIKNLLTELLGTQVITYQGHELDFSKENWDRIDYCKELESVLGFNALEIDDPQELKKKIVEANLFTYGDLEEYKSLSQIIDFVYKKKIREGIVQPTIIFNYPAVLKPLARRCDNDPKRVDVFQIVVCGTEICNAYSELVNPLEQRAAFEDQLKAKDQGDEETMDMDEDYLSAMEQGMPPISGLGFGIDRILMLIYDAPSIRDVVLFPMMKPENKQSKETK
mgnify:CR=1 FL=1